MLLYFVALMFTGLVILINQPRQSANRWAALFLGFASLGGLAYWLREQVIELRAEEPFYSDWWISLLDGTSIFLNIANQVLTPYAVLLFAMVYGRFAVAGQLKKWAIGLSFPLIVLLAVILFNYEGWALPPAALFFGAGPYYVASCILLVYGFIREQDRHAKKHRLLAMLIIVPTLLAIVVFILFARIHNPEFDFFRYISLFVAYSLVLGLALSFVNGVLGVRLKMENEPLDEAWQVIHSGTSVLNHTIKNEIGKIAISTENLRYQLPTEEEKLQRPLDIIERSTGHMQAMVERIQMNTREIVLEEEPVNVLDLVQDSVRQMEETLKHYSCDAQIDIQPSLVVLLDYAHLKEVLCNLIQNACEAMQGHGGVIRIFSIVDGKRFKLLVKDQGEGIPAEKLAEVLKPFYTTRDRGTNYGLGLSYCRLVMEKSGGRLLLQSTQGEGTTVCLEFARRKRVDNL